MALSVQVLLRWMTAIWAWPIRPAPATAMRAPTEAKPRAIPSPMPPLPPVALVSL